MSGHDDFNENASHRTFDAPYSSKHPVPTVQGYEEEQQHRKNYGSGRDSSSVGTPEQNGVRKPYSSNNRNAEQPASSDGNPERKDSREFNEQDGKETKQDTQQAMVNEQDPRKKRKNMKHMERSDEGREVTDPVTHLPVIIHDSTNKELKNVPENMEPAGSEPRTSSSASKSKSQLNREQEEGEAEHRGIETLFPPPNYQATRDQVANIYKNAVTTGLGAVLAISLFVVTLSHLLFRNMGDSWLSLLFESFFVLTFGLTSGGGLIWILRGWLQRRIQGIWDDEMWAASRAREEQKADSPTPESTQWLNSLLASIWPLINPDLFTSLADTLEDVMQASLPKLVRMISVEDLGQGSEAIRILGVRWLPTGAAAQNVSVDGKVESGRTMDSDRKVPGQGEVDEDTKSDDAGGHASNSDGGKQSEKSEKDEESSEENIAEGMEAEEGDFVNVEVAFSYRASTGKGLKKKAKNAHLYLAFYLPGSIRFPVWVELRGIVGTMRMRLQLCPDPPFFALCTMTLLGQPKADLSCVPLVKRGLNIMDLPIISSFVQSSIDAALAEYVAPKSLTIDLKDILVGDDFKKDTSARGILMVRIKRAADFKEGDVSLMGLKKGSSDGYVSIGWAKFGKPVWSTRVILKDMEPIWDETAFVLVGPEEVNAEERLRVQLWDSDRTSADDDLGRIEVDLKEIMHDSRSNGRVWDREDKFTAMDVEEKMPGTLQWSVGYFGKLRIQEEQLAKQNADPEIKTFQQLKDKVSDDAEKKLREATDRDESEEIAQQKAQGLKAQEDALMIASSPSINYPTGVLSIQIHNITGLHFEKLNKDRGNDDEGDETEEGSSGLPDSYCTVILNHQKIFKTRTKPKNSKPFFNAGTERVVRDWRTAELIISVRDARVHEDDPLMGIIYLPLGQLFRHRCQINDHFPLVGGMGYGRARISLVFRSLQLQAPRELLGWDYGTLEVTGPIQSKDLNAELQGLRLKVRSSINRAKMYPTDGNWSGKKDRPVRIAIRKRYSSCIVIEFRKNSVTFDTTPAFAVLWLKNIPDDEEKNITLTVWRGDIKRAESSCCDSIGDNMGSIEVPLRLLHGLGKCHRRLTSKNSSLKDIFEVLDTVDESREAGDTMAGTDESDSDGDGSDGEEATRESLSGDSVSEDYDKHNQEDGHRGPLDQIRDYRDHQHQLHRQNRGIMQWKGARTAHWMKTKVQHGKEHILDTIKHHDDRESAVETEA